MLNLNKTTVTFMIIIVTIIILSKYIIRKEVEACGDSVEMK